MPRPYSGNAGAKRGRPPTAHKLPERFSSGELLQQTLPVKKKWQLGNVIGQGGFGLIYNASDVTDGPVDGDPLFVIKIEPIDNGPLFCEFHFYQRAAKPESILEWTKTRKLKYLGVPQYLGSGQHSKGGKQYRFLVMPRFSTDLQKVFVDSGRCFSEKTTFSVGLRVLDALEFIHDKGYAHADIKASNILLGYSNGHPDYNQVYLVDYGLAARYVDDRGHKPYEEDPRRAHDGTAEYASRDAHKGVRPSRRGDLEILGYCMLEWLAGHLPWEHHLADKNVVRDLKIKYMNNTTELLKVCFQSRSYPEGLKKYLDIVKVMAYDEKPNYTQLRQLLKSGAGNEWTLNLPVTGTAIPARGVKRKNESSTPCKAKAIKLQPNGFAASPVPSAKSSKSSSLILTDSSTNSPVRTPAKRGRKPGTKPSSATNPSSKPRLTPKQSLSSKLSLAKKAKSTVKPSTSTPKMAKPVIAKVVHRGTPRPNDSSVDAILSPCITSLPKPHSSSAIGSRIPSQKKIIMKRKRNRNAISSDSAVQTSPGFGFKA